MTDRHILLEERMHGYFCPRCNVYHPRIYQAQPARDSWLPDVRDIVLSALAGFGVVAAFIWWWTA